MFYSLKNIPNPWFLGCSTVEMGSCAATLGTVSTPDPTLCSTPYLEVGKRGVREMEPGSLPSIQGIRKSRIGGRVPLPWSETTLQTLIWALRTMNCQVSLLENNPHHPIHSPHLKPDSNATSPVLGHLPEGRGENCPGPGEKKTIGASQEGATTAQSCSQRDPTKLAAPVAPASRTRAPHILVQGVDAHMVPHVETRF